ncbi:ATP-binding protein [Kitasatospora sp. NPDC004240]
MSTLELPCVRPSPAAATGESWDEAFTDRPDCVASVRAHARAFLERTRLPRTLYEDALLVISELVTNSVRHTRGPGTVHLTNDSAGIDITVSDTSRVVPQPRLAQPHTSTEGRGLHLVTALCDTVYVTLDPGSGKTVHAHLPLPGTPPQYPAPRPDPAPRPYDGRIRAW